MTSFPTDLASRLNCIYSPQEMASLWEIFSLKKRPTSFRVNTLTSSSQEIKSELRKNNIVFEALSFPKNCYLLDNNFSEEDLWKLDIYKEGKIYIQGISSQIPVYFFQVHTSPNSGKSRLKLRILDACAAPWGKTSQLAEKYPNAEIWAFEPHKIRYEKMLHNLGKLGISSLKHTFSVTHPWIPSLKLGKEANVISIHDSVENICKYIFPSPIGRGARGEGLEYFDLILIDAPCSGEGWILYNNTKFLESWDIKHIKKNYARQKEICDSVLPYLKTWGELIYSTCTLAPEENEWIAHYLLCKYPELSIEKIDISKNSFIHTQPAMKNFEKYFFKREISEHALRVIPSEFSEWFFVSKFKKQGA
jgi:16S rRNA C967 or C1407 C5-methylase (RsmB/RsmF family)